MINLLEKYTGVSGVIVLVLLLVSYQFNFEISPKLIERLNFDGTVAYGSSLGGLISSFIFAFYAVIVAYPNRFSVRIKKMKAYSEYQKYCLHAVIFGLIFSSCSIFIVSLKINPMKNSIDFYILSIWFGGFVSTISLALRAIFGFFLIVK